VAIHKSNSTNQMQMKKQT